MANEKLKDVSNRVDTSTRTFGSALDRLDTSTKKFRGKRGSIISSAKGNIFEFPVFISDSVPLDYAEATSALLEQVYASYLQMAISINPVIDHHMATNGLQFSGLRTDTNKYIEYTDTMWQHDACHAEYDTPDVFVEFNMLSYSDTDARVILENVNYQPLEEFEHYFAESKKDDIIANQMKVIQAERKEHAEKEAKIKRDADRRVGLAKKEAAKKQTMFDEERLKRAPSEKRAREAEKKYKDLQREHDNLENERQRLKDKYDNLTSQIEEDRRQREENAETRAQEKHERDLEKHERDLEKLELDIKKTESDIEKNELNMKQLQQTIEKNDVQSKWDAEDRSLNQAKLANDARVKAPKVLSEKDMEKLNTMKPILMTVDLNVKSDTGTLSPVEYVVGVKTYNRMIDADLIPEVATYPIKEMDKISRKAKWRAGELKFFSDIVFRIKEKKQTAADKRDPKRKWYRRLYELAHMKGDAQTANIVNGKSVIASFIFDKQGRTKSVHGLVPNVAMVVSKTDVDICKMKTGIDLLKGSTAAKFCNELFMMAFVVIDTDAESVKVLLPELHNEFDVHALSSINRQIASLDSSNKAMKNMFGLLNR